MLPWYRKYPIPWYRRRFYRYPAILSAIQRLPYDFDEWRLEGLVHELERWRTPEIDQELEEYLRQSDKSIRTDQSWLFGAIAAGACIVGLIGCLSAFYQLAIVKERDGTIKEMAERHHRDVEQLKAALALKERTAATEYVRLLAAQGDREFARKEYVAARSSYERAIAAIGDALSLDDSLRQKNAAQYDFLVKLRHVVRAKAGIAGLGHGVDELFSIAGRVQRN
jgi:tetratricopeptide (TPR) repeat protein